jgi:Protein of unknown function (DUF3540).
MRLMLKTTSHEKGLSKGVVQSKDGDVYMVIGEYGLVRSLRAAGCLLAPEKGDTVLVSLLSSGECWVITVLQKKSREGSLALPATTHVEVEDFSLKANRYSAKAKTLHTSAGQHIMESALLTLTSHAALLKSEILVQKIAKIRTVARDVREFFARHSAKAGKYSQEVEKSAQITAHTMNVATGAGLRVRSKNIDMKAETLLDMDAEQIKLG